MKVRRLDFRTYRCQLPVFAGLQLITADYISATKHSKASWMLQVHPAAGTLPFNAHQSSEAE